MFDLKELYLVKEMLSSSFILLKCQTQLAHPSLDSELSIYRRSIPWGDNTIKRIIHKIAGASGSQAIRLQVGVCVIAWVFFQR